jgi:hypothetical protein
MGAGAGGGGALVTGAGLGVQAARATTDATQANFTKGENRIIWNLLEAKAAVQRRRPPKNGYAPYLSNALLAEKSQKKRFPVEPIVGKASGRIKQNRAGEGEKCEQLLVGHSASSKLYF